MLGQGKLDGVEGRQQKILGHPLGAEFFHLGLDTARELSGPGLVGALEHQLKDRLLERIVKAVFQIGAQLLLQKGLLEGGLV